jgi:hypothetical protein
MAYCRFTRQSDVHVYEDVGGGLTCCGCTLRGVGPLGQDFNCPTRSSMIAHLEEHRAAGHEVEEDTFHRLREEIAALGDEVDPAGSISN